MSKKKTLYTESLIFTNPSAPSSSGASHPLEKHYFDCMRAAMRRNERLNIYFHKVFGVKAAAAMSQCAPHTCFTTFFVSLFHTTQALNCASAASSSDTPPTRIHRIPVLSLHYFWRVASPRRPSVDQAALQN